MSKTVSSGGKSYTISDDGTVYRGNTRIGSSKNEVEGFNIIKADSGANEVNTAGGGCFPFSARVLTPVGYRNISQISANDTVLSYDPQSGRVTERIVRKRRDYPPCPIWSVAFTSARPTLRVTGHHTMLTTRGWRRVDRLSAGDFLSGIEGAQFEIQQVSKTSETEPVYNLITYGEHNFIVDGIIAHNFTDLRRLKMLWYRLFFDRRRAALAGDVIDSLLPASR